MVALAILSVMAAVVGLAAVPGGGPRVAGDPALTAVTAARRKAVSSATAVSVRVVVGDEVGWVLALPDGIVVGAERFGMDPLSGRALDIRLSGHAR